MTSTHRADVARAIAALRTIASDPNVPEQISVACLYVLDDLEPYAVRLDLLASLEASTQADGQK